MDEDLPVFHRALLALLREVLHGASSGEAFALNPGDPGLLRPLENLDAAAASRRPMPGQTTVAQHVDHVLYGLALLNRWAEGEADPWATADWSAAWRRGAVSEAEWRELVARLREAGEAWERHLTARTQWDDRSAAGAVASAVHTAYHLGAIRQILAAQGAHRPA